MRLKKQSMREVADAGMVQRAQKSIDDSIADPIGFSQRSKAAREADPAKGQWVRGAWVKAT